MGVLVDFECKKCHSLNWKWIGHWWASWTSNPVVPRRAGRRVRFPYTSAMQCLLKEDVMIGGIGVTELIIILVIVIIIFGSRRLPELGSGIGKAIKNFKKSMSGQDEIDVTPKVDKKEAPEEKHDEKPTS